jgi:hypothetical protein
MHWERGQLPKEPLQMKRKLQETAGYCPVNTGYQGNNSYFQRKLVIYCTTDWKIVASQRDASAKGIDIRFLYLDGLAPELWPDTLVISRAGEQEVQGPRGLGL